MANFDDIIQGKSAQETKVTHTSFNKEEWVEKKKAERESAYALIDETAEQIAGDGALFQTYLDVQSRFDRYSVSNSLLITAQNPEAVKLADFDTWKKANVFIKKGETGILMLEPGEEYTRTDGSIGVSYNAKKMFDITQTTSRQQLAREVSYDPKMLLQALIHHAPCTIEISGNIPDNVNAAYMPQDKKILVRQGMDAPDIFRSIAQELAHAHMDKGNYKRSECAFPAYCAAYMLCKRYGVSTETFRFDRLPESIRQMDAKAMRSQLGQIREVVGDVSANMSRVLEPKQREQKNRGNDAR